MPAALPVMLVSFSYKGLSLKEADGTSAHA
jgi:hypothetical protein